MNVYFHFFILLFLVACQDHLTGPENDQQSSARKAHSSSSAESAYSSLRVVQPGGVSISKYLHFSFEESSVLSAENSDLLYQTMNLYEEKLSRHIELKNDITVSFIDCGVANAFYFNGLNEVVMCHELFQEFIDYYQDHNHYEEKLLGGFFWVLSHEIGHALIDSYQIPVEGYEEWAADLIATMFSLKFIEPEIYGPIAGAYYLSQFVEVVEGDPHLPGPVRLRDVGCWVVGNDDSVRGDEMIYNITIPLYNDEVDCVSEYEEKYEQVQIWLGDYLIDLIEK